MPLDITTLIFGKKSFKKGVLTYWFASLICNFLRKFLWVGKLNI